MEIINTQGFPLKYYQKCKIFVWSSAHDLKDKAWCNECHNAAVTGHAPSLYTLQSTPTNESILVFVFTELIVLHSTGQQQGISAEQGFICSTGTLPVKLIHNESSASANNGITSNTHLQPTKFLETKTKLTCYDHL